MLRHRYAALLMVIALLAGTLCPSVLAATAENVQHYDTYLCLGDSIAAGFGPYNRAIKGFERVDTAYHAMVADAVHAKTLYPYGCTGMRTTEVRYMLDPGYAGDEELFKLYNIPEPQRSTLRQQFGEALRSADLITLNVGSNDVLTYSFTCAMETLGAEDSPLAEQVKSALAQGGSVGEAAQALLSAAQTAGRLPSVLAAFVDGMYRGYQSFKENWDPIIRTIYAANPDVTLVVVGMVNPMKNVKLTDISLARIGSAFDIITRMIDQYMRSRSAYAKQYLYADVRDTEFFDLTLTSGTSPKDMINLMHPTLEGHKYIAQQIISVLPERGAEPKPSEQQRPAPSEEPARDFPFKDAFPSDWFYDYVYYCWETGLMDGMTDTTFVPQGTTTRAQLATVLWRMAGSPAVSDADRSACPFKDLTQDWYQDAVVWAYQNKVVNGVTDTTFVPDEPVTREQMVAMLYRYKQTPASKGDLSLFADRDSIAEYARPAVAWAVENGVVDGVTADTFQPKGTATRAQLAAILSRASKL